MNNSVMYSVGEELCTGCGACQNICPVNAIEMKENKEGFIIPFVNPAICISCGKCTAICPKLSFQKSNNDKPEIYAVRAEDSIRKVSSSGGVFTVLANWILDNHGIVCGAALNDKNEVHHICIDNKETLDKIRGSKYIQSNIGLVYREIKKYLERGRSVLFTGCPCQVAGLKNYLGKDYNNLYSIDILCHGVPSQKIFNRYLKEKFGNKEIINVKFRDKTAGWISTWMHIFFADQENYFKDFRSDIYEKIFHNKLLLRNSCSNCEFCSFPRTGDISMGDFWGIQFIDRSQNDGLGTSIVFGNNNRGRDLLEILKANCRLKKIQIDFSRIRNRIRAKNPAHPQRDRFAELIKFNTLEEAYRMTEANKFDVGLVGIYTVENFGGALTYFALYHTLKDLGYSVYMIERPRVAKHKPAVSQIYEKLPYPSYACAKIYETKEEMKELNRNCSTFIVGSDQMFNNHLYYNFGEWCTLDWVSDHKKKIAYAASYGHDYFWGTDETRAKMSYFMKKFDAFSVREESGVELSKREFGVNADWVLDPVFLCDRQHYIELSNHVASLKTEPYIGAYILDPTGEKRNILKYISQNLNLPLKVYSEMFLKRKYEDSWDIEINDGKIEERLRNIIESDFYVADSFHGVCFAIIFRKNFVAILNRKRGASRFTSILHVLNLEDRIVENLSQLENNENIFEDIDYDKVYRILAKEQIRCKNWLLTHLEDKNKKSYSDYDLLKQENTALKKQVTELEESLLYFKKSVSKLLNAEECINNLKKISNIDEYLEQIRKDAYRYLVLISVKDTAGFYVSESTYEKFKNLGCKAPVNKMHWNSYASVINLGKVIFEKVEKDRPVSFQSTIGECKISVVSKGLPWGNVSQIKINDIDYSINRRGFNFVIYDWMNNQVVDTICFDTHTPEGFSYRKKEEN